MDRTEVYAPITKRERDPETGHLLVYGKMTGPDLDADQQRMDAGWLKTAVPEYFQTGNIREMHQSKAVGKAIELHEKSDGWYIGARIVDKDAIEKVEADVLTGFSIGVKGPRIITRADAPNGAITGGRIIETSLVDRPALASCKLMMAKADTAGELVELDEPELVETKSEVTEQALSKADVAQMIADAIAALPKPEAPAATEPAPVVKTETTAPADEQPEVLTKIDGLSQTITESNTALTKALESLGERLAKVEAMPTAGGPVITATAQVTADDKTARVKAFQAKADAATDPNLAAGYRQMAADLLKEN